MTDFILTPEQHRALAKHLLETAGAPGRPSKERAAQMALNHETIARIIEGRQSGRITAYLFPAPPLAPSEPA